jgi:hypothetical protein
MAETSDMMALLPLSMTDREAQTRDTKSTTSLTWQRKEPLMSIAIAAHLAVDATSALARSALPDAPVEPDQPRTPRRGSWFRQALLATPSVRNPLRHRADPAPC